MMACRSGKPTLVFRRSLNSKHMNSTSPDLSSPDSVNSMRKEHEINIPRTPRSRSVSERGSINSLIYTMRGEHENNNPRTPGSRSVSERGSINSLIYTMRGEHENNNPSTSHSLNLPCGDLYDGNKEGYFEICLPLYEASITGDWEAAKVILDEHPEMVRYALNYRYETALHIAASAEPTKVTEFFLEKLVNRMENVDLELVNIEGDNACMIVVGSGNTKMAEIILNKNKSLLSMSNNQQYFPLTMSAVCGNHELTRYLYDISANAIGEEWSFQDRATLWCCCVKANFFDITLELLKDYPDIIEELALCKLVLAVLAGKPDALNKTEDKIIWKIINPIFSRMHIMKKGRPETYHHVLNLLNKVLDIIVRLTEPAINEILRGPLNDDGLFFEYPSGILFLAAEMGNTRFLIELSRRYPGVLWIPNKDGHTIFHIAIMHRHEGIYNLLYEIGSRRYLITTQIDIRENTILHLVGMTTKKIQLQSMSGASLLMQRELLWFQDVEEMVPPMYRDLKNKDGQTAYQLFFENNKDLVSHGLTWMKDCMVVATLIVTVAFAVAFTVPGGYNQDNGFPVFIHKRAFLVFILADAVSLFASTTSLLVFLSILTSRYGQRDFLYALPRKLMIGLVTLFISVAAMMVTFAASFFVLYRNGLKWVPIIISIFAVLPVILFAVLQIPLWLDMFRSMYDSRYLFKPKKRMLYTKNKHL